MKKIIIIVLFLIALLLIPHSDIVAFADNDSEDEIVNIEDEIHNDLNSLDLTSFDEFLEYLRNESGVEITQTVRMIIDDILNGKNSYDFKYFLNLIYQIFLGEISSIIPQMILIIIIAYLYGILINLTSDFSKTDVKKVVYIACYALIIVVIGIVVAKSIKNTLKVLNLLTKFADGCFPVIITLLTALGGNASSIIYQPFVLVFADVLLKMVTVLIMPLFNVTFVFGIVGKLSDNIKLDKFAGAIRKLAEWILGIVFGLFITILTVQGITGASFDGLASRGVKYALSSYVPIVGNYLKDGFDIVAASLIVIKNSLGLCSVILILFALLSPLISILTTMIALKITSGILEPITDNKFSSVLSSTADCMKILIIAILCTSFAALIFIMMIIFSCNFGVV